jgi:putative MATE family efflux protein
MFAKMRTYRDRWERLVRLGTPASAYSISRSLIGATDALVAASISPSAVAVVTIADLYRQLNGRIGGGIGGGAIALTSQDTGAGAERNRNEALSQAALLCVIVGLPFAIGAILFGEQMIGLVGGGRLAPDAVADGAAYLAVTLVVAPFTLPKAVFAQGFSAVGDTKTPAYIGGATDLLNLAVSVALGLGVPVLGVPRLGVLGLAIGTATAAVLSTAAYLVTIRLRSPYTLVKPVDPTVAKQIVQIGAPQAASGFVTSAAMFPFSRILVGFGTGIYAGYQVAWRLYTLTVGTVSPGLGVATKTLVGQAIGAGDYDDARFTIRAAVGFAVVLAGAVGAAIALGTGPLVSLFANEEAGRWTVSFARVLGGVAVLGVVNNVLTAGLQGASETRVGLLSRIAGMFGGMVGVTWLLGIGLDWGVNGAYVGIVATYLLFLGVTASGYLLVDWYGRATTMMADRGSQPSDS